MTCQPRQSFFHRLILRNAPESSKRAMAIWATWTLVISALWIGGSIAYSVIKTNDVGMGAVYAFAAVTVPLAGLAGFNYRKKEDVPPGGAA